MGRKKQILAALNYYAGPFFALISRAPNRTSKSFREHGQGNLSGFFIGWPFLELPFLNITFGCLHPSHGLL